MNSEFFQPNVFSHCKVMCSAPSCETCLSYKSAIVAVCVGKIFSSPINMKIAWYDLSPTMTLSLMRFMNCITVQSFDINSLFSFNAPKGHVSPT